MGSIPIARSILVVSHWPRVVLGGVLGRLFVSKITMRPPSGQSIRISDGTEPDIDGGPPKSETQRRACDFVRQFISY